MTKWQLQQLKDFDILLMSGEGALARLIRGFETETADARNGRAWQGIIDGLKDNNDHNIPIHSRMVFNSSVNLGCEMTWPKPRYCDLNEDCGEIIEVYRCPMLWGDDSDLMQYDIQDWWANFIKSGETYGIDNLVDFPTNLPEDQHHLVCSQTTTQSLLYTLSTNGINCTKLFPGYWLVASDDDNAMVTGKVSPLDQSKVFTDLGWRVSLT